MKKIMFLFITVTNLLYAVNISDISRWINDKNHTRICSNGVFDFALKTKNEGIMSAYAYACLQDDWINKLSAVIINLRSSKEARENAVYYSTILYKKKLLQLAMIDGVDISAIKLPKTDYVLSDIYDAYVEKNYTYKDGVYYFQLGENKYNLSIIHENGFDKIILKSFLNDKLISTKLYW